MMKTALTAVIAVTTSLVLMAGGVHAQSKFMAGVQAQAKQNHWDDLLELEFPGWYLTEKSAARMHDEIDFQRASQTYLWALPAINMYSLREGSEREFGKGNHILPVWKGRLRAKTKVTTPNSDVI